MSFGAAGFISSVRMRQDGQFACRLVAFLIVHPIVLIECQSVVGRSIERSVGQSVGWRVGRLVGRSVGLTGRRRPSAGSPGRADGRKGGSARERMGEGYGRKGG